MYFPREKKTAGLMARLLCGAGLVVSLTASANAMDLKTAVEIALETNPEIGEAAANRRAIGFEYQQAKQLSLPSLILEGRAGPELVDSRTTRILGNDDEVLFGRQASVTLQQNLYSFGRNNAERDRQASRTDAAAHRVWERTELVSLDVVQSYFDIMRLREIIDFADENVGFHQTKADEISRRASGGVQSEADAQQARERLSAALIDRDETEEAHDIAEAKFVQLVGQEIGSTMRPASVESIIPRSLQAALSAARKHNPTIKIAYADLDTARAEYRAAKSETKPELLFEVVGRAAEDIGGFEDTQNDIRAQVVFRHEFRGGIRKSAVQEHLNWTDEARQRLMRIERNVENIVREAWITRERTKARRADLENQVAEGKQVLESYQREFDVGSRTLLDILDSQASLFQAQSALSTAIHADLYAQYRLLASTGQLLSAFELDPRREAKAAMRDLEDVPPTPVAETEKRRNPKHYDKAINQAGWSATSGRRIAGIDTSPMILPNKAEPVKAVVEATPPKVEVAPVVEPAPAKVEAKVAEPTPVKVEAKVVEPMPVKVEAKVEAPQPAPDVATPKASYLASTSPVVAEPAPAPKPATYEQVAAAVDNNMPTVASVPVVEVEVAEVATPVVQADDSFPVGVPVSTVAMAEYTELSQRSGAVKYPSLNAVLVDNHLYLLDN